MYTICLEINDEEWDAFVASHLRASFFQVSAWGKLKAEFGWDVQRVGIVKHDQLVAGAQILYRPLVAKFSQLAYIPLGPLVDWQDTLQVQALMKAIHLATRQRKAAFLKIEPGYDVPIQTLQALGFRLSPQTVQPPRTILIDINGQTDDGDSIDESVILARMNQGTRRNIRKSEKHDVTVRHGSRQDVANFNHLLAMTSERQDFGVHTPRYYERVYDLFITAQSPVKATLLMASYTDAQGLEHDLAGVFVFALGTQSWYVYGASSNEERQRMASFGVQWAAILWAREQGAHTYDMVGIPDVEPHILEAEFENRHDGLWGVYRFKRGWGGRIVRTVGAWDYVYNPLIYNLYRAYLRWRS
ncbi:MAG: hypothetical protein CUN55_07785 [Phototrophicales bacterium]|nr:MAG: hypothetical protein CUN55_07785 [Phototrophicales bacterium]